MVEGGGHARGRLGRGLRGELRHEDGEREREGEGEREIGGRREEEEEEEEEERERERERERARQGGERRQNPQASPSCLSVCLSLLPPPLLSSL
jgi:hypothetical protein